jgi:hypothetical protein
MAIPGAKVRYGKWSNVLDLYDDGYNSAIWGSYDNNPKRCLGVRYNGEGQSSGFPNKDGFPLWYVEPDWVTHGILLELLKFINIDAARGSIDNVLIALQELDDAFRNP